MLEGARQTVATIDRRPGTSGKAAPADLRARLRIGGAINLSLHPHGVVPRAVVPKKGAILFFLFRQSKDTSPFQGVGTTV